jgi:hypothetical protein
MDGGVALAGPLQRGIAIGFGFGEEVVGWVVTPGWGLVGERGKYGVEGVFEPAPFTLNVELR